MFQGQRTVFSVKLVDPSNRKGGRSGATGWAGAQLDGSKGPASVVAGCQPAPGVQVSVESEELGSTELASSWPLRTGGYDQRKRKSPCDHGENDAAGEDGCWPTRRFTAEELDKFCLELEWQNAVLALPEHVLSSEDKSDLYDVIKLALGCMSKEDIVSFVRSKGVRNIADTEQLGKCLRNFVSEKSYMLEKGWNPKLETHRTRHADKAKGLLARILNAYDGLTEEDLCTGGQFYECLPLPSFHDSTHSPGVQYNYMARSIFKQLFQVIRSRQEGNLEVVFSGQPGVGKSVVFATVAGYLFAVFHKERHADLSKRSRRVIYLLAKQFVEDRPWYLLKALLLTYADNYSAQEELMQLPRDVDAFILWFRKREVEDDFYILVDEYNDIEANKKHRENTDTERQEARRFIKAVKMGHVLVTCASLNSETVTQVEMARSSTKIKVVSFDGPYTRDEVCFWASCMECVKYGATASLTSRGSVSLASGQSGGGDLALLTSGGGASLTSGGGGGGASGTTGGGASLTSGGGASLTSVRHVSYAGALLSADAEYFTGFNPRLLQRYSECLAVQDSEWQFNVKDFEKDTKDYITKLRKFIVALPSEKLQTLEKFLAGMRVDFAEFEFMEKQCFYVDSNNRGRCVSKHIQTKALQLLLNRHQTLQIGEYINQFGAWRNVIEQDRKQTLNMARIGWNVEALTILVLKIQGVSLSNLNLIVQQVLTYNKGQEEETAASVEGNQQKGHGNGILFVPDAFNEAHVDLVYRSWLEEGWEGWNVVGLQISAGEWANKRGKQSHVAWTHPNSLKKWVPKSSAARFRFLYVMRESEKQANQVEDAEKDKIYHLRYGAKEVSKKIKVDWISFKEVHPLLSFIDQIKEVEPARELAGQNVGTCGAPCKSHQACQRRVPMGRRCSQHRLR